MTKPTGARITFDTNVCNVIHVPNKRPKDVAPDDAQRIRVAIADRRIAGFISGASLFVECFCFPNKLAYLAVAGTPDARPAPNPKMVARFDDLASIGMELLRAPLIGGEIFVESVPWAKDEVYSAEERHERFCDFCHPLPGPRPLINYGASLLAIQPLVPSRPGVQPGPFSVSDCLMAIKREWDANPTKALKNKIGRMIAEWCDGLIVGSHVGYGNDIFCTTDRGKKSGANSLLHQKNRENLAGKDIQIMTPSDLVQHLGL